MSWIILIIYLVMFSIILIASPVNSDEALLNKYKDRKNVLLQIVLRFIVIAIITAITIIANYFIGKNIQKTLDILLPLMIILQSQLAVALITDVVAHRIDRNINRLGYISTVPLSILYLSTYNIENIRYLVILITVIEIVTLILFFVITSIGTADFRILLAINPISIAIFSEYLCFSIAINLMAAAIYQFVIQKKEGNRKLSVPIGHILLLTMLIQVVLKVVI